MTRSPLDALVRHARIAAIALATGSTACAPPLQARGRPGLDVGLGAPLMREHVIQPGETMWRIARRYGLTVDDLARHNGIEDPTRVRAGRVLEVPGAEPEPPEPRPGTGAPASLGSPPGTKQPHGGSGGASTPAAVSPDGAPGARGGPGLASPGRVRSGGAGEDRPGAAAAVPSRPDGSRPGGYRLRWPVEGAIVARFGTRGGAPHDGIDISVPAGTDVRAAAAGKVVFSGRHGGYGNLVIVRHDDGLVTIYAHNAVNLVRKGERVAAGEVLGRVGTVSRTGSAQLHFEVRQGLKARNPLEYLPP